MNAAGSHLTLPNSRLVVWPPLEPDLGGSSKERKTIPANFSNILQLFPNVKRIVLLQMAVEMEKEMRDISADHSIQAVESVSIHIFDLKKYSYFFFIRKFWCTTAGAPAGQVESAPSAPELQDVKYLTRRKYQNQFYPY